MMNFKQQELVGQYFQTVKTKFPEIEFLGVTESPEDPQDLWVNILSPLDEDRETELIELAGELTIEMLVQYGYHISIMPRNVDSDMTRMLQSHGHYLQAA